MLDLKRILNEKEKVTELLARKGVNVCFDEVIALDAERRSIISETE